MVDRPDPDERPLRLAKRAVTFLAPPAGSADDLDVSLRDQLSSLQGLLALSMLMTESGEESRILELAATSVPSLGRGNLEGIFLFDGGWRATSGPCAHAEVRADVERQFAYMTHAGGPVVVLGGAWGWAFPLRSLEGHFGYMVIGAGQEPPAAEQFLLRVLVQQAGIALANARLHARHRATAAELRSANEALEATVAALKRKTAIHDCLTRVAVAGQGQEGIAQALHDLTGCSVAIEDRHGNLRAWAGPGRPDPYPKAPAATRQRLLRRARDAGQAIRDGGRLLALANPREDVLGVLALIDPEAETGEAEKVALEHGATVLAVELARLRSLAETELRLGRDLAEELLAGADEESAVMRAQALGYDLERRHQVVVVESRSQAGADDRFFHAVRRAARDTGLGALLVARGGAVVVLADGDPPSSSFRTAVLGEMGEGRCRVGFGGPCERPADFPRSYREAQLALRMQAARQADDGVTAFDQLGIYRLLAEVEDASAVERFVQEWLGGLLDYDAARGSELVLTLTRYFECGGNYDATAKALAVHRSTLKYRLQRIRDVSGHDLGVPDVSFNLALAVRAWQTRRALTHE